MSQSNELASLQVSYCAGEVVFSEGDTSRDLYVLIRGKLEVLQKGLVLAYINQAGSFFGEMAMLNSQPRSATLRALESCSMLKVPMDKLSILMKSMPDLGIRIARNLARMVAEQNRLLYDSKGALELEILLKSTCDKQPELTLGEAVPALFKAVEQKRYQSMLEVTQSYLRSQLFLGPFTQGIENSLGAFFDGLKAKPDTTSPSDIKKERFCGVDFTGMVSGVMILMADMEDVQSVAEKMFGNDLPEQRVEDTLKALAQNIMDYIKENVPGFSLEFSLPEVLMEFKVAEDAPGLRLSTNSSFSCWIVLNK